MSDLATLFPPNASKLERDLEQLCARQIEFPAPIHTLWDPATCPVEVLPWLAWALSVDQWDAVVWSEGIKRAVIAASISVHQKKGTIHSVREVLADAGYGDVDIIEGSHVAVGAKWIVGDDQVVGGPGAWADYWIILKDTIYPDQLNILVALLKNTAPAHCHLTKVTVEQVNHAVGDPWLVADQDVQVGSTYRIGDYLDG